jgi:hypothetical protein
MPFYVAALLLVAATGLLAVLTRAPKKNPPALFSQINIPQITDGTPVPVVFGDVWIEDWTVLWYGNYTSTPIYANQKGK